MEVCKYKMEDGSCNKPFNMECEACKLDNRMQFQCIRDDIEPQNGVMEDDDGQ